MNLQKASSENWIEYYKRKTKSEILKSYSYAFNKLILNSFQKIIFKCIQEKIRLLLERKEKIEILSAGSGIDFIAYHLKKNLKIKLTIFDISPICISQNKRLFKNLLKYKIGDIYKDKFEEKKFDVVYNTGLLEHFSADEQGKIINKINLLLDTGGYYITLNPHDKGKLYLKYMEIAKRKNIWEFGVEKKHTV